MTADSLFQPYKIISKTDRSLHLNSGNSKMLLIFLRTMPILIVVAGVVIAIVNSNTLFFFLFFGTAVLVTLIMLLIKTPIGIKMDQTGAVVESLSVAGLKQKDLLWNDVDFIQHRVMRTKQGMQLSYYAVLKNKSKTKLLYFPSYHSKKDLLQEMNETLKQISNIDVVGN